MAKGNAKTGELRQAIRDKIIQYLQNDGEDARPTKQNELMFPATDAAGNEFYYRISISIPSGTREGEQYNGFVEAEDYATLLELKAQEQKEKEQEHARLIAVKEAKRKENEILIAQKNAERLERRRKREEYMRKLQEEQSCSAPQ